MGIEKGRVKTNTRSVSKIRRKGFTHRTSTRDGGSA